MAKKIWKNNYVLKGENMKKRKINFIIETILICKRVKTFKTKDIEKMK